MAPHLLQRLALAVRALSCTNRPSSASRHTVSPREPALHAVPTSPAGTAGPPLTVSDLSLSAPITLVLPDGQTIERVRLYEREQLGSGLWMFRIGVPLWQTAVGDGVEPAEYSTWVTAAQLRPLPGVDLGAIPAHPRTRASAPVSYTHL